MGDFEELFGHFRASFHSIQQPTRSKLDYLCCLIHDRPLPSNSSRSLSPSKLNELASLNPSSAKMVFVSITDTLFADRNRCLCKRKGFFKNYIDAQLHYGDTKLIIIMEHTKLKLEYQEIQVTKVKRNKKSFVIQSEYELSFNKDEYFVMHLKKIQERGKKGKKSKTQHSEIEWECASLEGAQNKEKKKEQKQKESQKYFSEQFKSERSDCENDKVKVSENRISTVIENSSGSNNPKSDNSKSDSKSLIVTSTGFTHPVQSPPPPPFGFKKKEKKDYQENVHGSIDLMAKNEALLYTLSSPPLGNIIRVSKENLLISINPSKPHLRVELLTGIMDPIESVLSCFVHFKGWNSQIVQEEFTKLMGVNMGSNLGNTSFSGNNSFVGNTSFTKSSNLNKSYTVSPHDEPSYLCYRSYKAYNFISHPRQTLTILSKQSINDSIVMLFEQNHLKAELKEKYTRAALKNIIQVIATSRGIKITVNSQFDAMGFCQMKQSQEMLVKMFEDVGYFQQYYTACLIKRDYTRLSMFGQHPFNSGLRRNLIALVDTPCSTPPCTVKSLSEQMVKSETSFPTEPSLNILVSEQSFNKLRPKNSRDPVSPEYLSMLIQRIYQKSYLSLRHTCNIPLEEYYMEEPYFSLRNMIATQYVITENKELNFINYELIRAQKDILVYILKQIGSHILTGKNVTNISMPVGVFESRSLLERSAGEFAYAPHYLLNLKGLSTLAKMKRVVTFLATIPTLCLVMEKPFNPILGETFQGYIMGIPICYEQISHHPPISAYYMKCEQFTLYGNLVAFADASINSAVGGSLGVMHVISEDDHFQCYFPPCQIQGLIYGNRKFRPSGRGYVLEKKSRIFTEFSIEKCKKGIYDKVKDMKEGDMAGGIFKITPKFIDYIESYENMKKFPGISKEYIQEKLAEIRGVWYDRIYIDEEVTNQGVVTYPLQYADVVLPSDSNYRLDVMELRFGDKVKSQEYKNQLENIQRSDKKSREKGEKNRKKK